MKLHIGYPLLSRSVVPACPLVNREDTAARAKKNFSFTFSYSIKREEYLYILYFAHTENTQSFRNNHEDGTGCIYTQTQTNQQEHTSLIHRPKRKSIWADNGE